MDNEEFTGFESYEEYVKSFTIEAKSPVKITLKLIVLASDILGAIIARLTGETNERALRHASMAMNKITSARGSLARAARAAPNEGGPMGLADFAKPILLKGEGVLEEALEHQRKRNEKVPDAKRKRRTASKARAARREKPSTKK